MNPACPNGHDYENAEHRGRADWRCPDCGADITLELVLLREMQEGADERPHGYFSVYDGGYQGDALPPLDVC